MPRLPVVRDHMDTVVHTLRAEDNILDAVAFLLDKHVTGAPVVNDDNEVIGIISEKDCLMLLAGGVDADVPRGTVGDYMTPNPTTVPPHMNVYFAAGMFLNDNVRRFPVVKDGKLVGAITRFDILRVIRGKLPSV